MAVAVASIAMTVVRLVVNSSTESTKRFSFEAAVRASDGIREEIRAELIADPLAPYKRVLSNEHPRVCNNGAATLIVEPGQSWPEECGTVWEYQQSNLTVGARITLPSPEDSAMTIKVASRIGSISAGYADRYIVGGKNRPNIYTGGSLEMSELRKNTTGAVVEGYVYATGAIETNATGVSSATALFATENVFSPEVTGVTASTISGRRYAAPSPIAGSSSSPEVIQIRSVYPSTLPSAGIRASAAALEEIACPSVNARQVSVAGITYSTHLCLHEGSVLINLAGDAVTVPNSVAYLLLPGVNSDNTINVFVRNSEFIVPGLPCEEADIENEIPACDLAELASTGIAAGTHPGGISGWTALGEFPLPSSGVVASDSDIHLGLCGVEFITGTCSSWSQGTTGVVIDSSFTIVVGSPSAAKNLYLAGPLSAGNGRLAAIVTGAVVVPYWSRPVGGDVSFDISLAIVGDTGQAINTIPSTAPNLPGNTGGSFTINGAVGAVNLQADAHTPVFSGYKINATLNPEQTPPLFALPSLVFERDTSRRLTATELLWLDPVNVRSTGRSATTVDLSWNTPDPVTGESVTGYEVEYRRNSTVLWTTFDNTNLTATNVTITGLSPGIIYQFRVITIFSDDQRNTSRALTTRTKNGVPSEPTALEMVSNTNSSITLNWLAPLNNGGLKITNYIVQFKSSSSEEWSTYNRTISASRTVTVTGLSGASVYEFRIAAVNEFGNGNYSSTLSTTTS